METLSLLRNLTELSPVINNRISELSSSVLQAEYDHSASINRLLGEALSLLIELLEEQGITFHVDDEQLLADRYSIGFIMDLYTNYVPDRVIDYIARTPLLCTTVSASVMDVADNEYLVKLLEAVKDTCRSEYNDDMYGFIHDKVASTSEYATKVRAQLEDLDSVTPDMCQIDISNTDIEFLVKLSKEREWFKACISNLLYKSVVPLDYHLCMLLSAQICLAYSRPENAVLLSNYRGLLDSNKEIIVELITRLNKESVFNLEHYTDEQLETLAPEYIVAIILCQHIDNRLFGIYPQYKRLIDHVQNVPVLEIVRTIPIQNTVN